MVIVKISPALLLVALAASPRTQDVSTYRHPALPVSIEAPTGWEAGAWRDDPGVLEVAAPDGSVQVLLWFTDTEQSADRYLAKMVGMKPVEPAGPVRKIDIGERPAWRVEATGSEQGQDGIAETFIAMDVGPGFPGEGTLVLQVWCPERLRADHATLIDGIVASLRVEPESG